MADNAEECRAGLRGVAKWRRDRSRRSRSATRTLAVYNIDGAFYVTDDECTHAAASLADGMLEGDVIECCMHMGSFHVPTGKVVQPPCEIPLRTYQVVLKGDDMFVDLGRNAAGEPA